MDKKRFGFTLVEIMIVVAIISMLTVIAVPSFVRARGSTQKNTCIQNLRAIEGATQQWALDTRQSASATVVFDDIKDYLKNSVLCPAGGRAATFDSSYELHGVITRPTCKILPGVHVLPEGAAN